MVKYTEDEIKLHGTKTPYTIGSKKYRAILYSYGTIEFLCLGKVKGYRKVESFGVFKEVALDWIIAGILPTEQTV